MKRAVISDIHSNIEALHAVLGDISSFNVDQIICLGDIVGYGPNPCECIDLVREADVCVLGNHDQGALFDPEGFSKGAERAIFWTRQRLECEGDTPENVARWDFLCELPRTYRVNGFQYVHGSARNPLTEYVFPEDVYNQRKLEKIFGMIDRHCFQGHTHVPGVFTESGRFYRPDEVGGHFTLGDEKMMVNVGSVGQPRDGECRACYVLQDENNLEYRRVPYDIDKTVEKIYAIAELDNFLGDRLREGR